MQQCRELTDVELTTEPHPDCDHRGYCSVPQQDPGTNSGIPTSPAPAIPKPSPPLPPTLAPDANDNTNPVHDPRQR